MLKRTTDLIMAAILAPFALAACAMCLVVIRLDSPGVALFRQTRLGRNRRPFTLYKLRTMSISTENVASHEVARAQITRVGRILRRTKLDELPQIINVLVGDMSFVGPRPCLPTQAELIRERDRLGVFAVRPGITGPAQIAGIDMSTPEKLAKADAAYVANQSFGADMKYIFQTAFGGGRGDAAK